MDSFDFGVMSAKVDNKIYCEEEAIWEQDANKDAKHCSKLLDRDYIKKQMKVCNLNKDDESGPKGVCRIKMKDGDNYKLYKSSDMTDDELKQSQCGADAYFFIQYACIMNAKDLAYRKVLGLFISCLGVFVYFFVTVYLDYIHSIQATKYVDFDV